MATADIGSFEGLMLWLNHATWGIIECERPDLFPGNVDGLDDEMELNEVERKELSDALHAEELRVMDFLAPQVRGWFAIHPEGRGEALAWARRSIQGRENSRKSDYPRWLLRQVRGE